MTKKERIAKLLKSKSFKSWLLFCGWGKKDLTPNGLNKFMSAEDVKLHYIEWIEM